MRVIRITQKSANPLIAAPELIGGHRNDALRRRVLGTTTAHGTTPAPNWRRTDPEVSAAVRSSITTARLARAHCISGRTERALQLYERIVTELDLFTPGPDRDLAKELWR